MMMNYFETLKRESQRCPESESFWRSILKAAKSKRDFSKFEIVEKLDLTSHSSAIEKKIRNGLKKEPLLGNMKSVYFGLFEQEDSKNRPIQGIYIAGSSRKRDSRGDFLNNSEWKPKWGYFKSKPLDSIIQVAQGIGPGRNQLGDLESLSLHIQGGKIYKVDKDKRLVELTEKEMEKWGNIELGNREDDDFFSYFLAFGAAIAIVKGVRPAELFKGKKIFVGFDGGDFLELA